MASSRTGTSPWVYIGCGCAALVALLVGSCVAVGLFGARQLQNFSEDLKDPVRREERALEMLGAEALPAGFHAQMFLRVPWIMEMVLLSDGEPADFAEDQNLEIEELGSRAFFYLALRDMGSTRRDVERLLEGERPKQLDLDLDFHSRRSLGRGEFDQPPKHVRWSAHAGDFTANSGDALEGIYTLMLIDCPSSARVHLAYYWSRQDLETIGEMDAPDLSGTPADEEALGAFLEHFELCPP